VVKFQIRHGTGRAPDGLTVHPTDEAQERLCSWIELEDLSTLVGDLWSINFDEAYIVRPRVETDLPQPIRIKLR